MRTVREILRLRYGLGLAIHQVAKSCNVSPSTVLEYERRAKEAGVRWPLPEGLDDAALERIVCGTAKPRERKPLPDIGYVFQEMKKPHVTLHLLWLEYKQAHPEGYQYTQFCYYYQQAKQRLAVTLRQEHRAGEKLFTDYAGDVCHLTNPRSGEVTPVSIFVAVLGASSYTYAEAVAELTLSSWMASHIRAFEFFGGAPQLVVPDNTKSAVIKPDRYEPDLNPAFADMAAYYGTAIMPARVRKPRDKAKVEAGVLLVERWILAALRHRTFFTLVELNAAIQELLARLNERPFQQLNACRRELFEKLDKPALQPLPSPRYEFLEWKTAKVGIDYHIAVAKHFYSVPYQLVGQHVEVRLSQTTVEILSKNKRVASHVRSDQEGGCTTTPAHMPQSHQQHLAWPPSRLLRWAQHTGPQTARLVERLLAAKPHPEMGYRACLGIIRLGKAYTPERLEAAADRALQLNVISYQSVKSILRRGLDRRPPQDQPTLLSPPEHANLRGREYYQNEGERPDADRTNAGQIASPQTHRNGPGAARTKTEPGMPGARL